MSLIRFFQTINASRFGGFIDKKLEVLKSTDPDRIYVENIRSFYNIPFSVAKFFCNMAVKENLFVKKIGVICPNDTCNRLILIVNRYEDIPDVITCENCELLEESKYEFRKDEVDTIEFYQLNRVVHGG